MPGRCQQNTLNAEGIMPRPVRFTIHATMTTSPDEIGAAILDVGMWPMFTGWGPLPGIRAAEFVERTGAVVGSRIAVTNTDGSTHTETITAWDLPRELALRLDGFSPPLSRFATHFEEEWNFGAFSDGKTESVRTFAMHPTSRLTVPVLWLIRPMLKAAVRKSMRQMQG